MPPSPFRWPQPIEARTRREHAGRDRVCVVLGVERLNAPGAQIARREFRAEHLAVLATLQARDEEARQTEPVIALAVDVAEPGASAFEREGRAGAQHHREISIAKGVAAHA